MILLIKNYRKKEIDARIVALILVFLNQLFLLPFNRYKSIKRLKNNAKIITNSGKNTVEFRSNDITKINGKNGMRGRFFLSSMINFCHCIPERNATIKAP